MSPFPEADFKVPGSPSAVAATAKKYSDLANSADAQSNVVNQQRGVLWTGSDWNAWLSWVDHYNRGLSEIKNAFTNASRAVTGFSEDLNNGQQAMSKIYSPAKTCYENREKCGNDLLDALGAAEGDETGQGQYKVAQLRKRLAGLESSWQGYVSQAAKIKHDLQERAKTHAHELDTNVQPEQIPLFASDGLAPNADIAGSLIPSFNWPTDTRYAYVPFWPPGTSPAQAATAEAAGQAVTIDGPLALWQKLMKGDPGAAVGTASKVASGASIFGSLFAGGCAAMDSWDDDTQKGMPTGEKAGWAVASFFVVGGLTALGTAGGEALGGAGGGALGGLIGGPPGAAVGAAIGATLGGVVGGYTGGWLGTNLIQFMKRHK